MADVTYTKTATVRRNAVATYSKGDAANVKAIDATVNIASSAAAGTTYKFVRVPSNARIFGQSEIAWDDLDDSNSATLDVGFASVDSNVTSDDDALTDGLDATTAGTAKLIKDHANYGKQAWEFVSGQTSDPGGELDLYVTLKDHAASKEGDVTVSLFYTVD